MVKIFKAKYDSVAHLAYTHRDLLATIFFSAMVVAMIFSADSAEALQGGNNDHFRTATNNLVTVLTGNVMRIVTVAGSVFMGIKAYLASSPMLLGGAVGIGLGSNFLLTWIKATYGLLI